MIKGEKSDQPVFYQPYIFIFFDTSDNFMSTKDLICELPGYSTA